MHYDLPIDELRRYTPDLAAPSDLDEFWTKTIAAARATPIAATFDHAPTPFTVIETFDATFAGFGGDPIRAWLHVPAATRRPIPAVVEFVGYGGGRGLVHERVTWALAGFAHFVVDTRGQGAGWSVGDTPDPAPAGTPAEPGFVTRGILDPFDYFYRRVFTDAVRAIDAVRTSPLVDAQRVAVTGGSQGGAIALAAASLADDIAGVAVDVPFLSNIERAITLIDTNPYGEIVRYLRVHRDRVSRVLETLRYFDVAVLVPRASAPALFSVALMDDVCPPSTVYAAFNRYGGEDKQIVEYPFNRHEGGQSGHDAVKIAWARQRLGAT